MQLINHVAFVLDESSSMRGREREVAEVFKSQLEHMSRLSQATGQQFRISAHAFGTQVRQIFVDTDVNALLKPGGLPYELIRPHGMTALIDAVLTCQSSLALRHTDGDDARLIIAITDGEENASMKNAAHLRAVLSNLNDTWTVTVLVPADRRGIFRDRAIGAGFAPGNVMEWEVGSATGFMEAATKVSNSLTGYTMTRASGQRGTTTMFANQVTTQDVQDALKAGKIQEIDPSKYMAIAVTWPADSTRWRFSGKRTKAFPEGVPSMEIRAFIEGMNLVFTVGTYYYELVKSEKVHPGKDVIVRSRVTGKLYGGKEARSLIGLTDASTRIKPQPVKLKDGYDIFVRTDADNRLLSKHSTVLVPR